MISDLIGPYIPSNLIVRSHPCCTTLNSWRLAYSTLPYGADLCSRTDDRGIRRVRVIADVRQRLGLPPGEEVPDIFRSPRARAEAIESLFARVDLVPDDCPLMGRVVATQRMVEMALGTRGERRLALKEALAAHGPDCLLGRKLWKGISFSVLDLSPGLGHRSSGSLCAGYLAGTSCAGLEEVVAVTHLLVNEFRFSLCLSPPLRWGERGSMQALFEGHTFRECSGGRDGTRSAKASWNLQALCFFLFLSSPEYVGIHQAFFDFIIEFNSLEQRWL